MDLAIRNVRIIDGTGKPPIPSASVVVEKGIIAWIGEEAARPRKHIHQEEVEGKGLTLIPGMIDCHEHFIGDGGPDNMERLLNDTAEAVTLRAAANARRAILSGVTSARDVGSRYGVNIDIARATATGAILGPRIIAAGEWLQLPGCWPEKLTRRTENTEELVIAIKEQIARGAGLIKLGTTGMRPTGEQFASMSPEAMKAAANTAHEAGLKITAHCVGFEGSRYAAESGIDCIEHGTYLDDTTVRIMARNGTYLVPTMSTWDWSMRMGPQLGMTREQIDMVANRKESSRASFHRALSAGVKIASGTDAGGSGARHGFLAREIELMVDAGMTPQQALESSTRVASELAGIHDRVGTVEVGKLSDLVLIDGDPLSSPAALHNVWAVFQGGRRVL